ncbi:hypothetical protein [Aquimonas voraii]|uniref:SGNH/GDSL hydrolase family protein n=1 Tax=Aquimonas voraii TaxID=265719 RepID=A0A1G6UGP8_9GAMM|nr:hypothetical protein [Aquimonas voraii]SDD40473.1 hypothetical protein SAMN04488509_102328 [Aquimonas voraii]
MSRRSFLAAAISALTLSACGLPTRERPERVLFVGNSLIYRNDLPNQFAQLASAALGRPVEAEMLARGGAHLSHHVAAGVVQRELASGGYTALVMQEFGGGLRCHAELAKFGFTCQASHAAHAELAALAQRHGARPVLLGSYRMDARGAGVLSQAEAELATRIGALHAGLGDFPSLRAAHPDWLWLDPDDGQHPGLDLTLLMALRTLRVLFQATLPAAPLDLRYRDYRGSQLPELDRLASAQAIDAPLSQRALRAGALAQRVRAAGWSLPPQVG